MPHDPHLRVLLSLVGAERRLSTRLEAVLVPFGLALAEYEVMVRVAKAGLAGVRMQDLAAVSLLTSSGLTRLVDRLEHRALIDRRPADTDQRGRACSATTAGTELVRRAQAQFLAALATVLRDEAGLDRKALASLAETLDLIASADDRG